MMIGNRKPKIAIIMISISIVLLIVYVADAVLERSDEGFLPFDASVRGFALGIPSVVLPIFAFVLTRSLPSNAIGILLLLDGIFILIGSTAFASLQVTTSTVDNTVIMENFRSFAPIIAMGAVVISLGIWKLAKS